MSRVLSLVFIIIVAASAHARDASVFRRGPSLTPVHQTKPALARSAGGAFVAWIDDTQKVFVSPFVPGSTSAHDGLELFEGSDAAPVIAASPTQYLAATRHQGAVYSTDVALVTPAAGFVQPVAVDIDAFRPAVAWNGETFLVAWFTGLRLKIGRVAADGSVTVAAEVPMDIEGRELVLVPGEGGTLLVWQEGETSLECPILCPPIPSPASIHWMMLDASGSASGPKRSLAPGPGSPVNPAAAWTGSGFLLTYVEEYPDQTYGNHQHAINALRLDSDGAQLDASPRVLLARSPGETTSPVIARNATGFFLAYDVPSAGEPAIEIANVTIDGTVTSRVRREGAGNPALTSYGAEVILVYEAYDEPAGTGPRLQQDVLTANRRRGAR